MNTNAQVQYELHLSALIDYRKCEYVMLAKVGNVISIIGRYPLSR